MTFYDLNIITVPMFTLIFPIIFCLCSEFVLITADIRITQFLRDPEALVSSNNNFKLGFFSPGNSTNRYVGIWYNIKDTDKLEVVWVANRDNPLNDTSGVLKVSDDGNLQLLNGLNKLVWSTNVSNIANGSSAQLLDYGNLVLHANGNGSIIWQSFENPTDSFLPPVKFLLNEQVHLSSWKSLSDPSTGNFTYGIYHYEFPELAIRNGDKTYWRSGPWNGYLGVPYIYEEVATGFSITKNHDGELEISYSISNQSSLQHYVLSYDGQLLRKDWSDVSNKWTIVWQSVESKCDIYGMCGPFGICNPRNSPICHCLNGFKPKNDEEWMIGNWTSGCVRKTPLQCGAKDGFLRLKHVKVPDNAVWLIADEDNCQLKCLGNCLCLAYAHYSGIIGCMTWTEKLVDVQQFSADGADLFIRLPHSELGKSRKWITILVVVVIIGVVILGFSLYYLWRWIAPRYGKRLKRKNKLLRNMFGVKGSGLELDLPLFELEMLEAATNKFDHRNKLGRGGFGPVYKGKLQDGQEIAVKRLSSVSGQGQQEFMNEVVVISKLQHRNLVKLLGCCVDGEEKLLVYEFMPNKSLDVLLFDETRKKLLDWEKRYNIIKGVCRGVLYLHRDSRLRIIHRDLKASNILLDEELNPKISDFGMARIFGGKEDKANTLRVVGTYGYMSPEYAMEGRFSEKSDVYSFGVLLLEIVSGQRNSSFNNDESLSLIAYAWKLWNEDNMVPFMDSTISSPSLEEEILKCIHVGLLCVEEIPEDRPTMSRVISMFENEAADLARPVQPGFPQRRISQGIDVSQDGEHCSVALLDSLTVLSGR